VDILSLFRSVNPAVAGSQITGYPDPNTMAGPVAPVRPQQAAIDALPADQNFPADEAAKGRVLAVIDPTLQKRQAEEKGLMGNAMDALSNGGLTADGRGRSKWGAFAHGLASGWNSRSTAAEKRAAAAAAKAEKDREFGLKERKQSYDEGYFDRRLKLDERKQNFAETPDNDTTVNVGGRPMKMNEFLLARDRAFREALREEGVADPSYATPEQIQQAVRRSKEFIPDPTPGAARPSGVSSAVTPPTSTSSPTTATTAPSSAAGATRPSTSAPSTSTRPPMEGARQAPDGNWYVQQNGRYHRVDPE
jgi:hypothetical protein